MTRAYHGIARGLSTHRHPNEVMAQPRSLTYRGSIRAYPDGNESDESRSPRGDKKPRKRNSVACARCRKRKIKCTGDRLDGNGCEACQAAGVPRSSCHYLRVNSHHIEDVALQISSDSEWPHSAPAPANYMTRITTDPSQYALANVSHVPQHVPTPYTGPGAPYSTSQARPPFNTNYPTSYNGQYDMQRPLQGPPLQMSQAPTPIYPTLDYAQQWNPLPSNGRPTSHTLLYDQDPLRYETSTVSYMASTGTSVPNVAAEGSPIFPGLSPLVNHLPAYGGNRTLPDPMSIHSSFDASNGSIQGNDEDPTLYQQHLETGTSQGSVSSASQDAINATGQGSNTSSSCPSETQEMSTLSSLDMTHTSPSASSENTSGFHSIDNSTTNNVGSYAASPTLAMQSNQHSNSQLPSLNSPFDGNGGHRGSHVPERPLDSGMAIRNGSVYDPHGRPRILQPQPRRSPSYDLLNGSFEGGGKHPAKVLKSNGHGRRPGGKQ